MEHGVLSDGLGWCNSKEGSLHSGSQWFLAERAITGFRGGEVQRDPLIQPQGPTSELNTHWNSSTTT